MKFIKKRNQFESSNLTFNPDTLQAFSYKWWKFCDRINGKVVFNSYSYSVSTSKHQYKIRSLLSQKGIEIDLFLESPHGLDDLNSAVKLYEKRIAQLQALIEKPKTHKAKNEERKKLIQVYKEKINQIKKLQK